MATLIGLSARQERIARRVIGDDLRWTIRKLDSGYCADEALPELNGRPQARKSYVDTNFSELVRQLRGHKQKEIKE